METLAESWSSAKLGLFFQVATEKSRVSISLYVEDSNSIITTSTVSLNMHRQHIKYLDICFTGFLDDIKKLGISRWYQGSHVNVANPCKS